MIQKHEGASIWGLLLFILALINVIVLKLGFVVNPKYYYLLLLSVPTVIICTFTARKNNKR